MSLENTYPRDDRQRPSTRWPKYMDDLGEDDFTVGAWIASDDDPVQLEESKLGRLTPRELASYSCNSQCCVVGHVRHQFGLPANPQYGGPTPRQGMRFLRMFVANWKGKEIADTVRSDLDVAELFDGGYPTSWGRDQIDAYGDPEEITPKEAARCWAETLTQLNYTVRVRG